ncbi:MAG: glycosyltransferase family 2 protein [Bacteroidetes bacterium]|jgi:glycosyltransferase involved in cell wall biosynthesis|nr:glycosyltransferase family 2 protein [Bacteroidota bacterium]
MTVSGFTFIRNGIKFDYPFRESILSLLPLVDELIVAVGDSADETRQAVLSLNSPKIRVFDTVWDDGLRQGGAILAQQTNLALDHVNGDWAFYLQGDEVLHEDDTAIIRSSLHLAHPLSSIEGILFDYVHFYGSYDWAGHSRKWYRREIRLIRNNIGIRSWGDAQGFRRDGKKLNVLKSNARVFHYGWVKPPRAQQEKQKSFHRFWHPDEWVRRTVGDQEVYSYADGGRLRPFQGTHPLVMAERIRKRDWVFDYDPKRARSSMKNRLLDSIEDATGHRIGEYKNYNIIR